MEVVKTKVEPMADEKQDTLLDIKLMKKKDETFTKTSNTGKADSLEESSLHTTLKFGIVKDDQEEKCDGALEKSEVKMEQPGVLLQGDVISKFSYSDDEDQGSSHYNVLNVKTETEFQRDIESGLERTSDIKTSVNICCQSQFPCCCVMKQEDHFTEDMKSPNNNICGETKMDSNTESEKIKQMLEACPHDIELGNSSESEYDEIEETSHISASDYSESEMSDEEPPPPQQPVQKKARLQTAWFGKDKVTKWEKWEHSSTMHTPAHNIYTWQPGPKGSALKAQTPYELWSLFVTQEIVDILVTNTNLYINEERVKYTQKSKARLTNVEEMKALLGLILLTGIFHSNRMNLDDLWNSDGTGVEIFRTTMSLHRFRFLLACLHFDEKVTRHDRRSADKLAPIRDVFEKFVGNCAVNYSHSAHVTIDEMLVGFRGKCPFRQYMPTKPAKYGIKIFALADSETYYVSKMEIYAGKQPAGPYQVNNSPTEVVTRLISPISGTGRNVTMDNWFTSYGLVQDLKKNHNLTIVGVIRKNKQEIPGAFLETKNRPVHNSMFGFQKDVTLVSYIPKKRKHVLLVSSMHHDSKIDPDTGAKKKPEIITFYDKTKGGVNMADQLSALYNTSRNSRRWPLTVFFMLMNISTINSYVIYSHNPQNKFSHRLLIKKIALELIEDCIKKRLELKNLKKELRSKIEGFSCEAGPSVQPPKTGKKHRCNFCERKNDRKVKTTCSKCGMHVCRDHYSVLCFHCQDRESDTEEPD